MRLAHLYRPIRPRGFLVLAVWNIPIYTSREAGYSRAKEDAFLGLRTSSWSYLPEVVIK